MPSPTERSLGLFAFVVAPFFVAAGVTQLYRAALFHPWAQAYHGYIVRVLLKSRRESCIAESMWP
ncbi:hypothetical protein GEV39_15640 [Pseudomonas sp. NY5710]|nr:hypothetical protein GEV39_15640 [Pseudomonas sp. NY5710]